MNKLYYGAAFYPEVWDKETILKDIEMMKKTGINLVRMGEFLWSKLELHEDKIDTSFITEMLDLLDKNDIKVVMCTPTPTPPIWLTFNHPERLHVDSLGRRMIHGSRQHVCTNNEYFRDRARKIISSIAETVKNHPAVVLWQLDNEFKCHVSECFCETCKEKWHKWLENRYETIENLNEKWGTMVWSETYESFEQIPQPFENTPFLHNSSLSTMYRIFQRDKIAEFASEQAEIIRKFSSIPITTNAGMGFTVDNETLFKDLDVVGFDTYASQKMSYAFTINCDRWRNIKKGKEYYLLETSASHTGALDRHAEVHPNGYLKSEAVANFALGGASFCYWPWRQQPYGSEQSHSAIISAWGTPEVGYDNVIEAKKTIDEIEDFILKTKCCRAEVAVTYSNMAEVFMLTESHKKDRYRGMMTDFYKNILETGVFRDVTPENASLDGYKILLTPFMYYISKEYLDKALEFTRNGGTWIVGPLSGGRTKEHTINLDAALGKKLEEAAGIETLYTYPIENSDCLGEAFNIEAPLKLWSAVFKLNGAKAIGVAHGGVTPNCPFITENNYGKGKIVMLGSLPYEENGDKLIKALINYYCEDSNVSLKYDVTEGTLVIPRHDDKNLYKVIVNMDGNGGKVNLKDDSYDVLRNEVIPKGILDIGKYEYRIIK